MKRVAGIEISYINWVLEQDAKFENGDWEVRIRVTFSVYVTNFGDPIGTDDLFAKWNRTRHR